MVEKRVTAQGWLGSTPEGQRPQIRGLRAGGALAKAIYGTFAQIMGTQVNALTILLSALGAFCLWEFRVF